MPQCGSPNVLLVVLDSVRAANCSVYDADHETTPFLDDYADSATVYDQARAPSNWTLPSHVSLLTGIEAHAHGVGIDDRLQPGHTIFERLASRRGYRTGLFTENGFLASHDVGIHETFQTVESVPETTPDAFDTRESSPGPDGFYYAEECLEWVDNGEGPWAACLNLMDAHRPYEPRPEHDRWGTRGATDIQDALGVRWEWEFHSGDRPMWHLRALESLYDGGIRQDDAILRRVIEGLRRRGVHDETLVVVVGDHGEGFGEPGQLQGEPAAVAHITPMQETLLHVPLIVSAPGQRRGRRVGDPAALTRFPAVVEGYTGLGVTGGDDGRFCPDGPVVASKQPITADLRERYERRCADPERFFAPSHAVYEADPDHDGVVRKQYHWGDAEGEFVVDSPRSIVRRATGSRAAIDEALDDHESVRIEERGATGRVDPDTADHLSALGYF